MAMVTEECVIENCLIVPSSEAGRTGRFISMSLRATVFLVRPLQRIYHRLSSVHCSLLDDS